MDIAFWVLIILANAFIWFGNDSGPALGIGAALVGAALAVWAVDVWA